MTKDDIMHLARLSRVRLDDTEIANFEKEITSILEYVSTVSTMATDNDVALPAIGLHRNIFRQDVVSNEPDSFTERILNEAPQRQGRFLAVKKILQLEE